jgi:motility quorum-sensing regulator/GCU-specific mRNA interferase toxin
LIDAGKVSATLSALASGAAAGFDFHAIVKVVKNLKSRDFHKSMTTFADHKMWQDVYRPWISAGRIYLKLTVTDGVLIVSFKEY